MSESRAVKKIEVPPAECEPLKVEEIYLKRADQILREILQGGGQQLTRERLAALLKSADLKRALPFASRLAALLLEVSSDAEARTVRLRGDDMAALLGATRTHVSTTLSEWKRKGLVVGFGQKLQIAKVGQLEKIARGDAA